MSKQTEDGSTANTDSCYRTFLGQTLKGFFVATNGDRWLIFSDGRALVLHHNGAHWVEPAKHVREALRDVADELKRNQDSLKNVLRLASEGTEDA